MKKKYITPIAVDIYAERLLVEPGTEYIKKSADTEHSTSKYSNVTVWDEDDDNWGFSGF